MPINHGIAHFVGEGPDAVSKMDTVTGSRRASHVTVARVAHVCRVGYVTVCRACKALFHLL